MDVRQCAACSARELRLAAQPLMPGRRELRWECRACGANVTFMVPLGQAIFAGLSLFFLAAAPWAAVTDRVAQESQRPVFVLIMLGMALWMGSMFVLDLNKRRKNPLVG